MSYNKEFWDKYANENEARYNEEFAKFTRDLAASLHCTSVLEIGCGTGIDLRLFSNDFQIHGVDLNDNALEIAKEKIPFANFKKSSITDLPFEDSSIDFIFTHQLLNYLDDDGYTYKTEDGSVSAQFEHTVLITDDKPIILTRL